MNWARGAAADLIDQVGRFDGPPQQFLAHLVAIQCRVGPVEGGAVLRPGAQEQIGILAVHPPLTKGATPPRWLAEAAESAPQVISTGRAIERPLHAPEDLYGQPARRHLIVLPIRGGGSTRGAVAFVVEASDPAALAARRARDAAAATVKGENVRFELNQVANQDLLIAQDVLAAAERDYFESVLTFNLALTELGRAQGTLLDSAGIELIDPEKKPAK